MFAPVCVTFHTVLEIEYAFLTMFRGNPGGIMLVAAITGVRGQAIRMAGGALAFCAFMIHREGVWTIIRSRFPCAGGVAGCAICAELTKVLGWFSVTGNTFLGRTFVNTVFMARLALHIGMSAVQFKSGEIVIERGWRPTCGGMAGFASGAVLAAMRVSPLMTGVAILRGGS